MESERERLLIDESEELEIIKSVSEAKLKILENYIPTWLTVLSMKNPAIAYIDAFAGSGLYRKSRKLTDAEEEYVKGSPLIVLEKTIEVFSFLKDRFRRPVQALLIFIERDKNKSEILSKRLINHFESLNADNEVKGNIKFKVFNADSRELMLKILKIIPKWLPIFIFVDPYGYPFPIPMINHLMTRRKTEVLLNLMWFRINIDMGSENKDSNRQLLTRMFGHYLWESERFFEKHGKQREEEFLTYVLQQFIARYKLAYAIGYGPEDRMRGKDKRTKYYLIHLTNHPKGAVEMKKVMSNIGDFKGKFKYSAKPDMFRGMYPKDEKFVESLIRKLVRHYIFGTKGLSKGLTFIEILAETADWKYNAWPYERKHYKDALNKLRNEGKILIITYDGKDRPRGGINDRDIIVFLPKTAWKSHGGQK